MNLPYISDSEAFLLGTISGESQARQSPLEYYEPSALAEIRLSPFVPQIRKHWVKLDEVPEDATRLSAELFHHERYGVISVDTRGIFALRGDDSPKSLTDLILELLDATNESDFAHLLRHVAVNSACDQRFADGEQFGQLLGFMLTTQRTIQRADARDGDFSYEDAPIVKKYETDRRGRAAALCELQVVKEVDAVRLAIKADADSWAPTFDEYVLPNGRIDPYVALIEMDSSLQTYWLCVGMVFRHLQDFPSQAAGRPLPASTPVESIKHLDSRKNIPTEELRDF